MADGQRRCLGFACGRADAGHQKLGMTDMASTANRTTGMRRAVATGASLGLAIFDVLANAMAALGRDASGQGLGMQVLGYGPPADLMM